MRSTETRLVKLEKALYYDPITRGAETQAGEKSGRVHSGSDGERRVVERDPAIMTLLAQSRVKSAPAGIRKAARLVGTVP